MRWEIGRFSIWFERVWAPLEYHVNTSCCWFWFSWGPIVECGLVKKETEE